MENQLTISRTYVFNLSFWGIFKMGLTTIIITEDKIICKLFGFIKFREILIKDVQNVEQIKNKWIKKGLSRVYIPIGLILTYKKNNKTKIDYIATNSEDSNKLFNLLKSKKNPRK